MIKETIVVEGKDDIANVKRAVDAEIIATNGLRVNKHLIEKLRTINDRTGIIILTDPDHAGKKIRDQIAREIPDAKHAYIDRKLAIKKNDLGVENAEPEVIKDALAHAKAELKEERHEFVMADLVNNGLSIGNGAKNRREALGDILGIGYYNSKQLLSKLNSFGISREEFEEAVEKL